MAVTRRLVGVMALGAALIVAIIWYAGLRPEAPRHACDLSTGCRLELEGQTVRVRTTTPVRINHPFELEVSAPRATRIKARFEMKGMTMVTPTYNLQQRGKIWSATVTLPFCITGRSDWVLNLEIDDRKTAIDFNVMN